MVLFVAGCLPKDTGLFSIDLLIISALKTSLKVSLGDGGNMHFWWHWHWHWHWGSSPHSIIINPPLTHSLTPWT